MTEADDVRTQGTSREEDEDMSPADAGPRGRVAPPRGPGISLGDGVRHRGADADARVAAIAEKLDQLGEALRESQTLYKRSRRRFHDFISATSDWLWETDEHGVIVFISDRITEILGRPAAVIRGRNLFDLGTLADDAKRDSMVDAIQSRRPFRDKIFDIRDDNGKVRRCHMSGMPVFDDESGRFVGYRGTGTDVTARYEAEEAARRSRDKLKHLLEEVKNKNLHLEIALAQAEASTHAKTEFLANVSHELRTPLNAIIGFAELLDREMFGPLGDGRYKGYVRNILDSARHLLEIIGDLLDMAKVESGQLELQEDEVDVAEAAQACIKLLSEQARTAGVQVTSAIRGGLPRLRADRRMMRQMLLNLLSNSIKFTPKNGRVTVNCERREDGRLAVTVTDTGIGIASQDIDKVLAPFGQVDSAFSRRHEGTGLGLPLVKAMIELHEGSLTLDSEPGGGTTATLLFPADRVIEPRT